MNRIVKRPKRVKNGDLTTNFDGKGRVSSRTRKNGASTTTIKNDGTAVHTLNLGDGRASVTTFKPPKTKRLRQPKSGDLSKEVTGLALVVLCAAVWFAYKAVSG